MLNKLCETIAYVFLTIIHWILPKLEGPAQTRGHKIRILHVMGMNENIITECM